MPSPSSEVGLPVGSIILTANCTVSHANRAWKSSVRSLTNSPYDQQSTNDLPPANPQAASRPHRGRKALSSTIECGLTDRFVPHDRIGGRSPRRRPTNPVRYSRRSVCRATTIRSGGRNRCDQIWYSLHLLHCTARVGGSWRMRKGSDASGRRGRDGGASVPLRWELWLLDAMHSAAHAGSLIWEEMSCLSGFHSLLPCWLSDGASGSFAEKSGSMLLGPCIWK